MPYLLAAIALTGLACVAAAVWSGQLPWLKVTTGAEALGPVGKPAPVLPPLPLDADPEGNARSLLVLEAERRAAELYADLAEPDAHAGYLNAAIPVQPRKES